MWQSTLFGIFIVIVIFLLRDFPARIRFYVGWIGLLKFIIPPALIVLAFSHWDRSTISSNPVISDAILPLSLSISETFIPFENAIPVTEDDAFSYNKTILKFMGIIWLFGSLSFFALWQVKLLKLRLQLRDGGEPFSESINLRLNKLTAKLDIKKKITGLLIERNIEPGVYGILHPTIILPKKLSKMFTEEELESILIHELSHVRYKDNLWAYMQKLLFCIFWFHPLIWWFNRLLNLECEKNCDEEVIKHIQDNEAYASGIFKVSKFCLHLNVAGVSSAVQTKLQSRIQTILSFEGIRNANRATQFLILVSLALFLLLSTAVSGFLANVEKPSEIREKGIVQENSAADVEYHTQGKPEERKAAASRASEIDSEKLSERIARDHDSPTYSEETSNLSISISDHSDRSEVETTIISNELKINTIPELTSATTFNAEAPNSIEMKLNINTEQWRDRQLLRNNQANIPNKADAYILNRSQDNESLSKSTYSHPNSDKKKDKLLVNGLSKDELYRKKERFLRDLFASRSSKASISNAKSNVDLESYKTFDWRPKVYNEISEGSNPNPKNIERSKAVIENMLTKKGLRKVTHENASLLVDVYSHIVEIEGVHEIEELRENTVYLDSIRGAPSVVAGADYYTQNIGYKYTKGVLFIDIYNTSTNERIWVGRGSAKINRGKAVRITSRDATRILADYPVIN